LVCWMQLHVGANKLRAQVLGLLQYLLRIHQQAKGGKIASQLI
jgi:hypothetical protein